MRGALIIGAVPFAFAVSTPPPAGLSETGWLAAGLAAMMAIWWMTEALPLAATALVPVAVWPLVSGTPLSDQSGAYAHPLIFLFLGGFLLASAIERAALHRRIAIRTLSLVGSRPDRVLAALMLTTAFLSLWISNTASAMVMAPIAAAMAGADTDTDGQSQRQSATVMLGVAFAATIGGMGTLIGTPPNALFAAYMNDAFDRSIGFVEWAALGVPISICLLGVTWAMLRRRLPMLPVAANTQQDRAPGAPMTPRQVRVAIIAGATALAWIARPALENWGAGPALSDAGIAISAALLLFTVPAGDGARLLDWETARAIRWDVLLLFGGGLALARIIETSGLAAWIGAQALELQGLPVPLLILAFAFTVVYLGELASNTAVAAIFIPVAGAAAVTLGTDPVRFAAPIALAASIGFMLPVATPPNAIVFSHPAVTRQAMLSAGAPLDVIGVLLVTGFALAFGSVLL